MQDLTNESKYVTSVIEIIYYTLRLFFNSPLSKSNIFYKICKFFEFFFSIDWHSKRFPSARRLSDNLGNIISVSINVW